MAVQAHDFALEDKYNTVIVSVTNAAFPIISDMTPEERQHRAERDELGTVELPLFILDNTSTVDKIKEFGRTKMTPFTEMAVTRNDFRVQVK